MKKISEYFARRRQKRNREIAEAVLEKLQERQGWKKFLPPVAVRDVVYMVTEDGSVYALKQDHSGMEVIMQIRN